MSNLLIKDDIEQLKEFRFSDETLHSELSIEMVKLLDDKNAEEYLRKLQQEISAPSKKVAASMFMKRYGFFAVLNLFSMTILNKRLNLSISNVSIETSDREEDIWYWSPKFHFQDLHTVSPLEGKRGEWREQTVKEIFHDNIYEILLVLARNTRISKRILWENIAIYIFWLYESLLENPKFQDKHGRIKDDFTYVIQEADGSLFGQINQNPFTRFYSEKVYRKEYNQPIRMRKTCCLYYLTDDNGERCKTCPISCRQIK